MSSKKKQQKFREPLYLTMYEVAELELTNYWIMTHFKHEQSGGAIWWQ